MDKKLPGYLDKWNLESPIGLSQTFTSNVYKVSYRGKDAVLKILNEVGQRDEANGAVALKCFDGEGSAILYEADESAHLLEFIDGGDLVELVRQGEDILATEIICDVLLKVHQAYSGPVPQQLTPLRSRFAKLFKYSRQGDSKIDPIFVEAAEIAEDLLENPENEIVLHGDIHHQNVLYDSKRGWLAIDPKGLYGENTFDIANTFFNPDIPEVSHNKDRVLRLVETVAPKMEIQQKRLLEFVFAYGCLSAVWSIEDGFDPSCTLALAKIIKSLIGNA